MAKYVKVSVRSPYVGTEQFDFYEVDDDFDPLNNEGHDKELWDIIDMVVADYVETDYEVLEGDWREDEDY